MLKFKMLVPKQTIMTMEAHQHLDVGWVHCQTSWPTDKLKMKLTNMLEDLTPKFVGGQAGIDAARANTSKNGA